MLQEWANNTWAITVVGGAAAIILARLAIAVPWMPVVNHPWTVAVFGGAGAILVAQVFLPTDTNEVRIPSQDLPIPSAPARPDCSLEKRPVSKVVELLQGYPSRPVFDDGFRIFVKAYDVRIEDQEVDLIITMEEYAEGGLRETIPIGRRREIVAGGLRYQVTPEGTGKHNVGGAQMKLVDYVDLRIETEATVDNCQ